MEDNILKILDDLDLEEVSLLLDQDFSMPIDKNIQNRIKFSVKEKAGFNPTPSKKNYFNKIKDNIKSNLVRNRLAFACSLSILFLGIGSYTYIKLPVAYVSVDINPSVELSINRFNNVVSASALNKDGQVLLNDIKSEHKNVFSIINEIIDNAIKEKYISKNKSTAIAIASISNDYEIRNELENDLKNSVNSHFSKNSIEGAIYSYDEDISKRDAAKKIGLSVGKMNLIEDLISFDKTIDVDDYKNKSVLDIDTKILEFKDKIKKSNKTTDSSIKNVNSNTLSRLKDNTTVNDTSSVSNSNNSSSSNNSNNNNGDFSSNKPSTSGNDDSSNNSRPGNSENAPGHNKPNYNDNHHNRPNNNNGNHYGHDKYNNGNHYGHDDKYNNRNY
ncbi:hypothetical protein [Romboutsia lituseburensis]|uniref:anti-sigma-I factor RsgI family protein n=1 Tax=Romboutsia lituseburensis TaxID=1537 RepID=UPI00215B283C|nr:hypothetical protein [Romboutsia lituseburensis]MCR8746312.1 hypothetical protein [Romboutsia lituseburensis]